MHSIKVKQKRRWSEDEERTGEANVWRPRGKSTRTARAVLSSEPLSDRFGGSNDAIRCDAMRFEMRIDRLEEEDRVKGEERGGQSEAAHRTGRGRSRSRCSGASSCSRGSWSSRPSRRAMREAPPSCSQPARWSRLRSRSQSRMNPASTQQAAPLGARDVPLAVTLRSEQSRDT